MAFRILEITDSRKDEVLANVDHQNHQFPATVRGVKDNDLVGNTFQAELEYEEILSLKVLDPFHDEESGIWQEPDGIHLRGRVHNILDYGDGKTIIDVYMQNGPEFFTVRSDIAEDFALDANTGLEIVVNNLYIYLIL